MNACEQYYAAVRQQLELVYTTQRPAIERAAGWLGEALVNEGWLYAFGTGHSHMLAEEIFYRAGGLARAVPILDPRLMLHESASESTRFERQENYATGLWQKYSVRAGDLLLIVSNSGRNPVPIDLALLGRERGAKVVAVTNLQYAKRFPSRHSSGKSLAEVADLAIDNCGVPGDACLELATLPGPVGPTSTLTSALIVNGIVVRGIELALARGTAPEIYISSNAGGDEHNRELLAKYQGRIRHL
jgi:uncharacterized phosphosugar-binding protein